MFLPVAILLRGGCGAGGERPAIAARLGVGVARDGRGTGRAFEGQHAERDPAILMLPAICMLAAIGAEWVYAKIPRQWAKAVV